MQLQEQAAVDAAEEQRESGDGDSGAESKEVAEPPPPAPPKAAKKSRIPVRRSPPRKDAPILEAPEPFRSPGAEEAAECDAQNAPEAGDAIELPRDEDNSAPCGRTECAEQEHCIDGPSAADGRREGDATRPGAEDEGSMMCADLARNQSAVASIAYSVAECAQAPGCSRASTATESAASTRVPTSALSADPAAAAAAARPHLSWTFRNGRLVFQTESERPAARSARAAGGGPEAGAAHADDGAESDGSQDEVVLSKTLNRRCGEGRSRLRHLEQKLQRAGIVDAKQVVDGRRAPANADRSLTEGEIIPELAGALCEFSAPLFAGHRRAGAAADGGVAAEEGSMGADGGEPPKQHNPDHGNLKSLLKRPGRTKKPNRVVFNENKNEFFDADYIILIREECDYDDEDDDGVCTCNQHEMVRLTCCEPNCSCHYDGYEPSAPQSPKFAPPLEFVDAVTLSPPEGYKDMELGEQQLYALQQMTRRGQARAAVCRECSFNNAEEENDDSQSDECAPEANSDHEEEKEKTDQSQQTTPTTPPDDSETITMTTVTERSIIREVAEDQGAANGAPGGGSPISGILKGGRLWKQPSADCPLPAAAGAADRCSPQPAADAAHPQAGDAPSDEEGGGRRSVRFIEAAAAAAANGRRDGCDGAPDNPAEEEPPKGKGGSANPEATEMMLTFKLGNHVLISNNSLKPNSAVRQLFPCTKPISEDDVHQYVVTAESLKAFEEAKRLKLPQIIQSGETDESIKRAIERNTLRRSLIRYEPRTKKNVQKTDNSLVERIKQLTCDVDEPQADAEQIPPRASPPGEEAPRSSPDIGRAAPRSENGKNSPSSGSSSSSSTMSSTYRKITDLFGGKKDRDAHGGGGGDATAKALPDLGNGGHIHDADVITVSHNAVSKVNSTDSRRQFLSTLAPLTACVGGVGGADDYHYHISSLPRDRVSVASSVGTEYSLEDIDEGLKGAPDEEPRKIAPDVIAGTPCASESGDELAMFVQQDASRIERIKKKYQPDPQKEDDDEHDDYGFNRRPSVRGIKPRFGSTTEILQQIQNQLQPPQAPPAARLAWPYYSESGLTDVPKQQQQQRNFSQMPHYPHAAPEEGKGARGAQQYRPTSLQEEGLLYQNCVGDLYRANINHTYSTSVVRVAGEYYQPLPRARGGRPQSPPPLEMSKAYHQTMLYIPYNHIEGYQLPLYQQTSVASQNQLNKRYVEPLYQQRIPPYHLEAAPRPALPCLAARGDSPLPGQFSTARATQTHAAPAAACGYYHPRPQRPLWPQGEYATAKMNRHSFPSGGARYPAADQVSLTDSESGAQQYPNGFVRPPSDAPFLQQQQQQHPMPASPTKPRFIERGVPEGAASVSPQDASTTSTTTTSSSTMTSPTSPQTHQQQTKPLFYAMNV